MNDTDEYLLSLLNEGMAANIPKIIQTTTELLENPRTARHKTAKKKASVKRRVTAYLLWRDTEGKIIETKKPRSEDKFSFLNRVWTNLDDKRKKEYEVQAEALNLTYKKAVSQKEETSLIKKVNESSSLSISRDSSPGDNWFDKMTITTASDPQLPIFY